MHESGSQPPSGAADESAPPTSPTSPDPAPADVTRAVLTHYRAAGRDLPWRHTTDPYAVWVSEVMLQQTRVAAVIPYYERWLARFPDVAALAAAPLDDVLAAWSGLGYYSRARNLHKGAREVVARFAGQLPSEPAALRQIPGVGRYTAGAIASIAFARVEPVVDGNVARVLARVYEIEGDIKSRAASEALWQLAGALVQAAPDGAPGDFNQGLMELGATLCAPRNPACTACPLRAMCRARIRGREAELPVKPARKRPQALPLIDARALWIERRGRLLLARRAPSGLYGGLWELPQTDDPDAPLDGLVSAQIARVSEQSVYEHRQVLTHRRLRIRVFVAECVGRVGKLPPRGYDRYDSLDWHDLSASGVTTRGVSAATRAIIDQYGERDRRGPGTRRQQRNREDS